MILGSVAQKYMKTDCVREELSNDKLTIIIEDPQVLGVLCGPNDSHIKEISRLLSVPLRTRGNQIILQSRNERIMFLFRGILDELLQLSAQGETIYEQHVNSAFTSLEPHDSASRKTLNDCSIQFPGNHHKVYPRGNIQTEYIKNMATKDLIFSTGPAGTGKTYLAIAHALFEFLTRKKRKIILTRPVVETGESLGFLPGDLTQKLAPYLRPLYDAMEDLLDADFLEQLRASGQIEVAPLAYMRGRSLRNCSIVLDEAQNTTIEQMKMFLTRIGHGSKVIVTGDLTQIDLADKTSSGLANAVKILKHLDEVAIVEFSSNDVVRHPLVRKIIEAYENQD